VIAAFIIRYNHEWLIARTRRPVVVVVAAIRFTMTAWLSRGWPR
jgi:hypothetical protein